MLQTIAQVEQAPRRDAGATRRSYGYDLMTKLAARGAAIEPAVGGLPPAVCPGGDRRRVSACLAIARRRLDLIIKAGTSSAVFAALLAFSGWQAGSLTAARRTTE